MKTFQIRARTGLRPIAANRVPCGDIGRPIAGIKPSRRLKASALHSPAKIRFLRFLDALARFSAGIEKTPCARARFAQIKTRPIRTCLWSCVGRRGSGQEASQPPLDDRQPEANRRTPPNGGRDLKQRRTGLFWSLPALQRSAPKEACLSCRACGRESSLPNDGCERPSEL